LGGDGQKFLIFGFGHGLAGGHGFFGGLAVRGVVDGEVIALGGETEGDATSESSAGSSDENDGAGHKKNSNPNERKRDGGNRFL
jgi:hypothetical protein